MERDFSELLRKAKAGDADALRKFHSRYERLVLAVVRRRLAPELRRRFDTADLAQSVFEDVLRDLPGFEDRGEDALRHWLCLKAENKVRDAWRRQLNPDGGVRESPLVTSHEDDAAARVPGPATQAGDDDDRTRLRELLAKLPAEQREVLMLRDTDGLAFAEIASRLGLPSAAAARMRYARALVALRDLWNSD